jgi:hypothetical protein
LELARERRAEIVVDRDVVAGLRRAIAMLREQMLGLDRREATSRIQAERDAAREAAASRADELGAPQQ